MNRLDIEKLLIEAKRLIKHPDYVIIGSLSVLGTVAHPPNEMTISIDVDMYPKSDPHGHAPDLRLKSYPCQRLNIACVKPSWSAMKEIAQRYP